MVAASKLRRAQELAESSRVYADSLAYILSSLAGKPSKNSDLPEILTGRENPKTTLLIINSSDRGLCGGFNSNLFRNAKTWIAIHVLAFRKRLELNPPHKPRSEELIINNVVLGFSRPVKISGKSEFLDGLPAKEERI